MGGKQVAVFFRKACFVIFIPFYFRIKIFICTFASYKETIMVLQDLV
jgi:hypothetical protein